MIYVQVNNTLRWRVLSAWNLQDPTALVHRAVVALCAANTNNICKEYCIYKEYELVLYLKLRI